MSKDKEEPITEEYNDSYANQVNNIINTLTLDSETDRRILKSRFLAEVLKYEKRKEHTKKYYNVFRFIVTIGSIFLPAILSLGQMDPAKLPANFDQITYWSSWTISLMVTASNGFLQLFSLDKNYFEFSLTSEQLKTEGWQFFQLSGKYEDYEDHKAAYRPFCKSIENIKRKQVEKEFSGKGEVKKKKEFNFAKEFKNALPDQYERGLSPQTPPSSEASILSLLGKIAPDKIKEVSESIKGVKESVEEGTAKVEETKDGLTYPTQP